MLINIWKMICQLIANYYYNEWIKNPTSDHGMKMLYKYFDTIEFKFMFDKEK